MDSKEIQISNLNMDIFKFKDDPAEVIGRSSNFLMWYDIANNAGDEYINNFDVSNGALNFAGLNKSVSYNLNSYASGYVESYSRSDNDLTFDLKRQQILFGGGPIYSTFSVKVNTNKQGSANDLIKYSTDGENILYAKIGFSDRDNAFVYSDNVNLYLGGDEHKDTLNFSLNHQTIDISGEKYLSIDDIDSRNSWGGNRLIGNSNDNVIYASLYGDGDQLWGGAGGNDTLVGGAGYDEFFYSAGSGNDVVQNANSDDVINLLGVSLSQISGVNVNLNEVNINFNDGGSLRVEGNSNVGYRLENQTYVCNQSTGEWSVK